MDINYYRKINNLNNVNNKRESEMVKMKRYLSSEFDVDSNPLAYNVQLNNENRTVLLLDESIKEQSKKVICKPDEQISCGDVFYWLSKQQYWIVTQIDASDDIYPRGIAKRCVGQLKWVDEDGIIHSSYFTFKSDPATNFGVQDGRILTVGNERRNIIVSKDEHTTKFKKSMRFIFDSRAWVITAIDTLSVDGLSIITLDEDLINLVSDNPELGIANYFKPQSSENSTSQSATGIFTLELTEEPSVRKGSVKTFTIILKANNVIDTTSDLQFFLHSDDKLSGTLLASITNSTTRTVSIEGNDYGDVYLRTFVVGHNTELWNKINIKGLI